MECTKKLDRVKGSLLGGAVGDALGYPIEFMDIQYIRSMYGKVTHYASCPAQISDDTQMTLFTACGLLYSQTREKLTGNVRDTVKDIHLAYLDWLKSQKEGGEPEAAWILSVPALNDRRAPGMTCLGALSQRRMGTMEEPLNHSKGCGGVMRVAPIGQLFEDCAGDRLMLLAAGAAAITHGHPGGYVPAAGLSWLVNQLIYGPEDTLENLTEACAQRLTALFEPEEAGDTVALLQKALALAKRGGDDCDNIAALGGGWVGDEALAIAVYCCLRHPDSFADAVCAAVNHSGDSDSTGSISGNIMGAALGLRAIPAAYIRDLELADVIEEIAEDIASGVPDDPDATWRAKYANVTYTH